MTKKIKISEIPAFDAAEYLTSDEEVAAYLTTILEENDAALLAAALGDIARSKGMSCSRVLRPKRCWRTGTAASR
jgi:DNA-binding phage protein